MTRFSFRPPPRRRPVGDAVPMINVAFLLLVFFLLAARIAPPDMVEVTLPEAEGGVPVDGEAVLLVGAGGELAFGVARGEAALAALAAALPEGPLVLEVDRGFGGGELAALLARLRGAGVEKVALRVAPPS